jgi:hypothetical protein
MVKTAIVLSREPDVSFGFINLIWAPAFSILLIAYSINFIRTADPITRKVLVMGILFGTSLAGFYGLFFGHHSFLVRYLFPLSPILLFLTCAMFTATFRKTAKSRLAWLGRGLRLFIIIILVWFHYQIYNTTVLWTADQSYFKRVDWVAQNLPAETWVGGFHTGVLGYFHDKTINLSGRVNPQALEARLQGHLTQYILDSEISYLVDEWRFIKQCNQNRHLAPHFELVHQDTDNNIGVLRRITPPAKATDG